MSTPLHLRDVRCLRRHLARTQVAQQALAQLQARAVSHALRALQTTDDDLVDVYLNELEQITVEAAAELRHRLLAASLADRIPRNR